VDMDTRKDLALLRVAELRAEAEVHRLVREARATRRSLRRLRPSPLRTAVGIRLVRAGVRLGGSPPASAPASVLRSFVR
jgi:hypothetical protein